ncbi:hypothetical protein [Kineococcus indalonis]|uniref:hypothetical protein n=1 Tax=Kineococcus indalonis TaxID=2696566 RepID=UPI0014128C3A|nr:hypothetical protein [Kineococcus indalonis]NAZ84648.1 hypothetical protein [Kineococcus indalonis]
MTQLRNVPVTAPAPATRRGVYTRALLAAVAVVLLVVGAPVALVVFAGNPLPEDVSWTAMQRVLSEPDIDGGVFLQTLAVVGWLGWASLFISIVVEVIAFARHRPAPRLGAAFSVQQQFTAGLIGAITLLFLAPASVAAAAAPVLRAQHVRSPRSASRRFRRPRRPPRARPRQLPRHARPRQNPSSTRCSLATACGRWRRRTWVTATGTASSPR